MVYVFVITSHVYCDITSHVYCDITSHVYCDITSHVYCDITSHVQGFQYFFKTTSTSLFTGNTFY